MNRAHPELAVVVGGSGAVGTAICANLTGRGFTVIATYGSNKAAVPRKPSQAVSWVHFDAREPGTALEVQQAVGRAGIPLAVVIYAAGTSSSKQLVADTPVSEFGDLFTVNTLGLVAIWQALAPAARQAGAAMVTISSQAAQTLSAGNGAYSASKAALEALVATLAKEESAHGVRVNAVSPSLIDSPQARRILALKGISAPQAYYRTLPAGRALSVGEVAETIVAIATDQPWRHISGQVVQIEPEAISPDAVLTGGNDA
jgi:NAD(P)-dependent dehydrogenase (short-subunit alcohol dehydrogenase family)